MKILNVKTLAVLLDVDISIGDKPAINDVKETKAIQDSNDIKEVVFATLDGIYFGIIKQLKEI